MSCLPKNNENKFLLVDVDPTTNTKKVVSFIINCTVQSLLSSSSNHVALILTLSLATGGQRQAKAITRGKNRFCDSPPPASCASRQNDYINTRIIVYSAHWHSNQAKRLELPLKRLLLIERCVQPLLVWYWWHFTLSSLYIISWQFSSSSLHYY